MLVSVALVGVLLAVVGLEGARAVARTRNEPPAIVGPPEPWGPTVLRGTTVAPGKKERIALTTGESFSGAAVTIPVLVARGTRAGPVLCLTAGVHGDELNGVEVVRQVFDQTDATSLRGMLIALPVVNLHGFRSSSRYLPDRRDLNRYFPGSPNGSSASRLAHTIFRLAVDRCDALVDFHTASFHRTNLPQLRADLTLEHVLDLAVRFGIGVVVHSYGMRGTLRRSAAEAGLPAITYEAGEPMRFEQTEIDDGVTGVTSLMASLGMTAPLTGPAVAPEVYRRSRWVRANEGGIFLTEREVGERVSEGDLLGTVIDPVSNERSDLESPFNGRIIGMALPQVVIPGFAMFHIGLPAPEADADDAALSPDQLDAVEQPE